MAMNARKLPELSKSEFDILRVLWSSGSLTVREVHDLLKSKTGWAYSTTKTMMDRMAKKGLLKREEFHRIFIYTPLISKVQGLVKWLRFISDSVFETDPVRLVAFFRDNETLSEKEIEDLKHLLEIGKEGEHDSF
jgi:predicted transcriptional regulator